MAKVKVKKHTTKFYAPWNSNLTYEDVIRIAVKNDVVISIPYDKIIKIKEYINEA